MAAENGNTRRPNWVRLQYQFWELLSYRLTAAELHIYIRVFCVSSHTAGKLPIRTAAAAKLAGIKDSALRALIENHPYLFETDNDALIVRHAAEEIADSAAHSRRRSDHARKAATARWHPRVVEAGGDGDA